MALGMTTISKSSKTQPEPEYTRLHITPLNPALLESIIPRSVLPSARNISFHSLQTFPEKDFGFVDLPTMEAQKIKKKLNGSILKGTKVRIEEARPTKQPARDDKAALLAPESSSGRNEGPLERRKKNIQTIPAVELRDRKVKRGWTDPAAPKKSDERLNGKKDAVKSKYTLEPECLFRATLPANVVASSGDGSAVHGLKSERRKKRKLSKNVIIHEFSKTSKHAKFLRSSSMSSTAKGVSEYVEGKGWVDETGTIVEAAIARPKKAASSMNEDPESSTDSSVISEMEDVPEVESITGGVRSKSSKVVKNVVLEDSSTSSSGTSLDGEDSDRHMTSESESESESKDKPLPKLEETNVSRPTSSSTTPIGLTIDIPKTTSRLEPVGSIHPLEALFKRRRPDDEAPKIPEALPSFSFFGSDAEDDDNDDVMDSVPMTPFTQRDFALRGQRSAAPTPDTAHPGKTYTAWPTDNQTQDHDTYLDGDATPTNKQKATEGLSQADSTPAQVSDFQKWFYEHRGETNRAWKKRRKLAAKEKRQRENRKRGGRAA